MIYFALAVGTGTVKIGHTDGEPQDRLAALATGCPHDLVLLHTQFGDTADEAALHRQFDAQRVRGEWFRLEGPLTDYLADAIIAALPLIDRWNERPWVKPAGLVALTALAVELGRQSGDTLWEMECHRGFGSGGTVIGRAAFRTEHSTDLAAIGAKLDAEEIFSVISLRAVWWFPLFLTEEQKDAIVARFND